VSYPDFSDLKNVNKDVNENSIYMSDHEQYGRSEVWTNIRITGKGDCEDYGIAKLRDLLALKWPIESLRLCKCYVEPFRVIDDETKLPRDATMAERYHGILIVTLDNTDWVLCNRKSYPVEANMSGYTFDLIQVPGTITFQKASLC
jgi:predicted transglutaminase-like cysteine proteinase